MDKPRKVHLGQLSEASWYELGGGDETEGKRLCVKGLEIDVQPRAGTGAAGTYQLQETI